jgi:hypothetical protein
MSHELRTPLNGVLGYAQLLQRDRSLTSAQREALDAISKCGSHLLDLINDILDLSKIEAGFLDLETVPTDLAQLAVDLKYVIGDAARRKGLLLTMRIAPEVPRRVMLDGRHLRQVLLNLLGNAIKFTAHGEVRLEVGRTEDDRLLFEVSDTGIGIERGLALIAQCAGRDGNHGNIFRKRVQPQTPRRVEPVEIAHLQIHEHDVGLMLAGQLNRLESTGGGDDADPGAFEKGGENAPVDRAVVGNERGQLFARREPGIEWRTGHLAVTRRRRARRRHKAEREKESTALARRALDAQRVTHPLDQMVADRQAGLELRLRRPGRSGEDVG